MGNVAYPERYTRNVATTALTPLSAITQRYITVRLESFS